MSQKYVKHWNSPSFSTAKPGCAIIGLWFLTVRSIRRPEAIFDTFSQLTTTCESLLVMREHILRYTHRTDTVTIVAIAVWAVPELAP